MFFLKKGPFMNVRTIFALLLVGSVSIGLNAITDEEADNLAIHYLKQVSLGEQLSGEMVRAPKYTGPVSYKNALVKINNSQMLSGDGWVDMSKQLIFYVSSGIQAERCSTEECILNIITKKITALYNFCTSKDWISQGKVKSK
jgi:hypothetical protein